jgi:hypothetical protein
MAGLGEWEVRELVDIVVLDILCKLVNSLSSESGLQGELTSWSTRSWSCWSSS